MQPEPLLTVAEVAIWLARSRDWVRLYAVELGGVKVGNQWRFDRTDIQAWLDRGKTRDPLSMTELFAKRQASHDPYRIEPRSARSQAMFARYARQRAREGRPLPGDEYYLR